MDNIAWKLGFWLNATSDNIDSETLREGLKDAEEAVKKMPEWMETAMEYVKSYAIKFAFAIVVFMICKKLMNILLKVLTNVFERTKLDEGVSKFLISLVKALCYVVIVISVAQIIGIQATVITSSFTAIVASAGLTIGLALQGSLQNFSGGVLILILKPFKLGDYIIAEGYEGVVETIDIFYTKLLTVDNRMVVLPNGTLSNTHITNVTREDVRRLDLTVGIEYSESVAKVKELLLKMISTKEMVLTDHDVNVYVNDFLDSSVSIGIRVWCKTEDYWTLRWDMLESIKNEFDEAGIVIPFNQLDVNMKQIP